MLQPKCVSEVLEKPRRQVIRDDGRDLNLWIRSQLPPFKEQLLRRLQESQLCLGARNRVQFSKSSETIARIISVSYCSQKRR